MRKCFVAGNWKMFTTAAVARHLAENVVRGLGTRDDVRVALCPPFPYLADVREVLRGTSIALGAQNCYPAKEGAFTGEVSPTMLLDIGCRFVIIGHSERRHQLGESNSFINRKVRTALDAGLEVILCLGETLDQREASITNAVLEEQLAAGLHDVPKEQIAKIVLAYEPVWAIGTGRNASPAQAQEAHAFLRRQLGQLTSIEMAGDCIIQYGGSVKPENALDLMTQPDVDGALVGGASLKADQFLAIVSAAASKR
jgi:triosephosphate isomerase